ncbi:MAG: tRNA pseudouridine(38-40) synthase TruA [Lutibacter sp.]|nr:tRNA pseudouridine(38-40) synthase TruA [Lutibacter sp.]
MRYFIALAYKGTKYHGWQYQPNALSIQECVQKALSTILRTPVELVGAGRTDAGVHAVQLYAHTDLEEVEDPEALVYKVNAFLPNDIVLKSMLAVHPEAHARFDALSRSYEYRILLERDPFLLDTTWQLTRQKLDIDQMNTAAKELLNHTNFKCFSRSNSDVKTFDCQVSRAEWVLTDVHLVFHITANRFLRNMVRAIVGTLIEVGLGKTSLDQFTEIILSRNRSHAGPSAPAQGLFLTRVNYPEHLFVDHG